jgi:hypothetical protein
MSQSDVEENNTAVRRGNDVDVETIREKERKEQKKIGSTGLI